MKKNSQIFILFVVFCLIIANSAWACTNFLVTKGATVDGSTIVSYAADSHVLYGELYYRPAADYPEGAMFDIYEWDTGKFLGKIKQVKHTYSVVGNMNENQVTIGETTYGGREELFIQPGATIDYGNIIYVSLQRAKTAREAIKIMSELMDEYGYASEGESFSVADANEVWFIDLIGKGRTYYITKSSIEALKKGDVPADILSKLNSLTGKNILRHDEFIAELEKLLGKENVEKYKEKIIEKAESTQKGAVWVAMLIPDGYISCHANQARITTFPFQKVNNWTDTKQTVYHSKDVISFAREKGYFKGKDQEFSFSDTYAPLDFSAARFCEIRVWAFFNTFNKDMAQYWDYVKGHVIKDEATGYAKNRIPLWIKPDRKIWVHEVMDCMRNHLEGTELDMSKDIGAGPFGCPYRWRPLTWKVDSVEYINERAVSTQQTGFSFVAQARAWLPGPIGGIFWFGVDDAASSVYVPIYCGITEVPKAYAQGNGSMMDFTIDAAFWVFNMVSNFAYTRFNVIWPEIRNKQLELENRFLQETKEIDSKASELYKTNKDEAVKLLTYYSVMEGDKTRDEWFTLYTYLFTKYMDGNIKTRNEPKENYKYVTPEFKQPGYGEEWYRRIAKETGDKFKVIGEPGH
ncbi:MAG: C69 family dipeptidase [Bacteroidia bacterium]|nr:C69 family dipeptidase [Bacteroidia bacterium]